LKAWIRLDGAGLGFAAGHFATFGGDLEPLHGHNYRVVVELTGPLTADSWVIDFRRVKAMVRAVCEAVDHKFLLQANSSEVHSRLDGGSRVVEYGSRRYVMPEEDVVALPIDNTTAERLAEWFAQQLVEDLRADPDSTVEAIRVGIEEAPGQSGWFSATLADS
jgi:6-pyruvoyltetrahydropterin/6-carboxytetrahydropterin synthase